MSAPDDAASTTRTAAFIASTLILFAGAMASCASHPVVSAPLAQAVLDLPLRKIPNLPDAAEAYYAPDSLHVIAQVQDPLALHAEGKKSGALTWTFTDQGEDLRRINDHGQDGCSYFFPDGKRLLWTSTRDHLDWPIGNWSNEAEYPQGAELYSSDLDGKNVKRLTDNAHYDAEVTSSPDGKWVFFTRQVDGALDLWRMRPDGSGQEQLTFTPDWQEGAPYPLPDGEHIIFRAWRRSDRARLEELRKKTGQRQQTPMTIFTARLDGTDVQPRTFTDDMNWAPYPTPDGRHFLYVRVFEGNNWEVVLGDLAGGAPVRLTTNEGFDGFPSISPDGRKVVFARSEGPGFMAGLKLYVLDVSSLHLGPEYAKAFPPRAAPPPGWVPPGDLPTGSGRPLVQSGR
jgi:Tol biopolymer transport system component